MVPRGSAGDLQTRESRSAPAGGAELRLFEVEPLDGVRGGHHAAPVGTVPQAQRVSGTPGHIPIYEAYMAPQGATPQVTIDGATLYIVYQSAVNRLDGSAHGNLTTRAPC